MRNNYFRRLWHYNKLLYLVILLFIGFSTLLSLSKSVYNPYFTFPLSPFYTWDMFSAPYPEQDNTVAYELVCDGETRHLPAYSDHRQMFYTYTIGKFDHYAASGYTDGSYDSYKRKLMLLDLDTVYAKDLSNSRENILRYPAWLKSYLSRNLGRELKSIQVYKHYVHYNEQSKLEVDSSVKILDQ